MHQALIGRLRRCWASANTIILGCARGVTLPAEAGSHPFLTLDVPGAKETDACRINDAGQTVGEFRDAGGKQRGDIATPPPRGSGDPLVPGTIPLLRARLANWIS